MADSPQVQVLNCGVVKTRVSREGDAESRAVRVFAICLDKPDSEHNLIDRTFGLQFARAVYLAREKAARGEIDLVVLCSAKQGSFLAGADILLELKFIGPEGAQRAYADSQNFQNILCVLEALPVPSVAILNGTTLGGGLELALACDYRIADSEQCKQIGCPEVKLGVMPGGGGCCRLPRLIGFRQSLDLIATGQAMSARKALALGLVDHVIANTQTSVERKGESGQMVYDYQWLSSLTSCIAKRRIGSKPFDFETTTISPRADSGTCEEIVIPQTEEEVVARLLESWEECEEKAVRKYPRKEGRLKTCLKYLLNVLIYAAAVFQVWVKVGFTMPAPYLCLQTTFRCFYTRSWMEAMSLNALGFTTLASTAESKSFMGLFLITRKLKKFALTFGLKGKQNPQEKFDKETTGIFVAVSGKGLCFSSAFIQSLLYSGLEVHFTAVDANTQATKAQVCNLLRKHYDYALKKRHMTSSQCEAQIGRLHWHLLSDTPQQRFKTIVLVNAAFSSDSGAVDELKSALKSVVPKVVLMDLTPGCSGSEAVCADFGDPLRKNTLCVEVGCGTKVEPEDVRLVASLISALGKMPVPVPTPAAAAEMSLSHWALAARLVATVGISVRQVDSWLTAAGFSKGPFATLKELDKDYVNSIVKGARNPTIDCSALEAFLQGRLTPAKRKGKISSSEVVRLFIANIVSAALALKKTNSNVPEVALDVLCVSGLVHFPATEGGPLNYLTRIGAENLTQRLTACGPHFKEEAQKILLSIQMDDSKDKLFATQEVDDDGSEFTKNASDLIVLSDKELKQIGATKGLQNLEVILYPLPYLVILVLLLLTSVILLSVLGPSWSFSYTAAVHF